MTDHSKAKAGKAANKNHKVVRIVHAGVKVAAKNLQKVAGVESHKVSAKVKTGAPKTGSHDAKMAPHKAGSELKKR
jgi:hypothetical protein